MVKNFLLIFVRNPELGKVKTRLAHTVGDAEALRIYTFLLEKTREIAGKCAAKRLVFYAGTLPESDAWNSRKFTLLPQVSGDLGERMEAAFVTAFERGAEKVVIVGSDCPEITAEILEKAFISLDHDDAVIGPVVDGGYYLLGLKRLISGVFHNIEWSTASVRAQTEAILLQNNATFARLPELSDIDTETDWKLYLIKNPNSIFSL